MRRLRSLILLRHQLLEPLYLLRLLPRGLFQAPERFLLPTGSLFLTAGSHLLSQRGLRLLLDHANKRGHLLQQFLNFIRPGAFSWLESRQMCLSLWCHYYLHTTMKH